LSVFLFLANSSNGSDDTLSLEQQLAVITSKLLAKNKKTDKINEIRELPPNQNSKNVPDKMNISSTSKNSKTESNSSILPLHFNGEDN
jgi:hypothetical protein